MIRTARNVHSLTPFRACLLSALLAAKAAAKKAAAKKAAKPAAAAAPAGKKAAAVVESESESEAEKSESEAEEEVSAAPKSKSAIKKAKAKAKEAAAKAEAEKAAKAAAAAEKKQKKKGAAAAEPAPVAAASAAPVAAKTKPTAAEKAASKAAAAAAAADTEGWETIEAPKPTKSQLEKQALAAAAASAPAGSSTKGKNGKSEPVPSSERMLTVDMQVDPKFHSLIIGSKGVTLNLLVAGSGASIDMPKRDAQIRKNVIQITGTPAQVASAQNAILSLTTRGFSNLTHPGTLSDDLTVDPKDMGLIMGPQGATVKLIQKATGAEIKLPERNSNDKKVLIVGEKEAVRAAKAALKSLIADGYSPITHPEWIKEEVDFPADRFGILIGNKGQTIKSIQGNSKNQVRIKLPERGSKSSTVTVVGLPAAVAQARKEIERLLEPPPGLADPEETDLATDDAWGQEHTAKGEDALW